MEDGGRKEKDGAAKHAQIEGTRHPSQIGNERQGIVGLWYLLSINLKEHGL